MADTPAPDPAPVEAEKPPEGPPQVQIGWVEKDGLPDFDKPVIVTLIPPKDRALEYDLMITAAVSTLRARSAALAMCWHGRRRPKTRLPALKWDLFTFGGAVYNELVARYGVDDDVVLDAGEIALGLIQDSFLDWRKIKARESFSAPPEAE